jgi:hypothetical protein
MNIVADHVKQLLCLTQLDESTYRPSPKESLSLREVNLFWRYHGHFPNDFAKAIQESLPQPYKFVSYDHLLNRITVEIV